MTTDLSVADSAGAADVLLEFGFNGIEAAIYQTLRRNPGLTGYRIAKLIGKQQANTYQALASLLHKGAVLVEEAETRTYSAVPPHELIGRLRRNFAARCDRAETVLAEIGEGESADRIEYIKNVDQVYERARSMLNGAKETLLIEVWPGAMSRVQTELEAAAGRGVSSAGLVLESMPKVPGLQLITTANAAWLLENFPGNQITLIVDGRQALLGSMSRDNSKVISAVWTDNPYLSMVLHNGIVSDILFHRELSPKFKSPNLELLGRTTTAFEDLLERSRAAAG